MVARMHGELADRTPDGVAMILERDSHSENGLRSDSGGRVEDGEPAIVEPREQIAVRAVGFHIYPAEGIAHPRDAETEACVDECPMPLLEQVRLFADAGLDLRPAECCFGLL